MTLLTMLLLSSTLSLCEGAKKEYEQVKQEVQQCEDLYNENDYPPPCLREYIKLNKSKKHVESLCK